MPPPVAGLKGTKTQVECVTLYRLGHGQFRFGYRESLQLPSRHVFAKLAQKYLRMQVTYWEVLLSVRTGNTGVLAAEGLPLPFRSCGSEWEFTSELPQQFADALGGPRTLVVEMSSIYIGAPSFCYDSWEGC